MPPLKENRLDEASKQIQELNDELGEIPTPEGWTPKTWAKAFPCYGSLASLHRGFSVENHVSKYDPYASIR